MPTRSSTVSHAFKLNHTRSTRFVRSDSINPDVTVNTSSPNSHIYYITHIPHSLKLSLSPFGLSLPLPLLVRAAMSPGVSPKSLWISTSAPNTIRALINSMRSIWTVTKKEAFFLSTSNKGRHKEKHKPETSGCCGKCETIHLNFN